MGSTYLDHIRMVPDIDRRLLTIDYWLSRYEPDLVLKCDISLAGKLVAATSVAVEERHTFFSDIIPRRDGSLAVDIPAAELWSPESPTLYDVKFTLLKGERVLDEVQTYTGMRKVHAEKGRIYLNNEPYYLRMVLDQGFWPEGVYTAPSVEAIRYDVDMTKSSALTVPVNTKSLKTPITTTSVTSWGFWCGARCQLPISMMKKYAKTSPQSGSALSSSITITLSHGLGAGK